MKKFNNYCSNLDVLKRSDQEDLTNEFIIGGIIDKFSIQFELGWKTMKDILKYEGISAAATGSPREIIKQAYKVFDSMDESIWLDMLRARNDMSHIYDGNAARTLVDRIISVYIPEFLRLQDYIEKNYSNVLDQI